MTRPPCAGKHALFDSTEFGAHRLAAALCATCPLIDACREHLADVRRTAGVYGHPEGTWAGELLVDLRQNAARRLATLSRDERIAAEDATYSDADARRAHTLYTLGDRREWTRVGHRVYDRRRKRRQRVETFGQEAS